MSREVVFNEVSPGGEVTAYVVQDDRVAYFYIQGVSNTQLPLRSCWVRNLVAAPEDMDLESMSRGLPALLPEAYCKHAEPSERLLHESLEVVWFEEGDAAALLEDDEVIAVIPCWSGRDGFHGYALECAQQNPLCWPLMPDNPFYDRIERAQKFWSSWEGGETPWDILRRRALEQLEGRLGRHHSYYAIDGGTWPPKGLLRLHTDREIVLVTIGMSLRPQPTVELYLEDPASWRRIELAICLPRQTEEDQVMVFARLISLLSGLPWSSYRWYGHGHTAPCELLPAEDAVEALLFHLDPLDAPNVQLGRFMGDPVNLLWLVPLTGPEREVAREYGSGELLTRLRDAGVGWCYRRRGSIV